MANRIPEGIRAQHILSAIDDLNNRVRHPFGESTVYDLLFNGHRYPPKAVIGLALGKLPRGKALGSYDFKGGLESKCFDVLEANDFVIVTKTGEPAPAAARKAKRSLDASNSSQGNPDWTRDELIIALDVYLQTRPTTPGKTSKGVCIACLNSANALARFQANL